MKYLKQVEGGTEIKINVITRASGSGIAGEFDGSLRVRLNSPPVDGAANKELIKLLSKCLKIAKGRLEIVRGETSREKTVIARNLKVDAVSSRISIDQR